MRFATRTGLLWLASMAQVTLAVDAVYVTDLQIYTLLAPCAADALSYDIAIQTMTTRCGNDVAQLQKCICSSSQVFSDVSSRMLSDVASSCGTDALQDRSSVQTVLSQYCTPSSTYTFATPTDHIVQAYITDVAEMEYLPPCARSALSEAVMGVGSRCPLDASLYAPCVCSKDNVTPRVSETLTNSVKYSCSNNEDITAAQNFYHEYCAMNNGTTSFAKPTGPPGDMSYYVTAMTQFKSLNSCAQSAVSSALNAQTAWLCGSGPQALASCVCLKSGILSRISSTLTSEVKYFCDNTATAQVTSALSVLDIYCSAAADKTSLSVDQSISETAPVTASGPKPPSPTSTGGANGGNSDNSNADDNKGSSGSSSDSGSNKNQTATIAGGVAGGVVALALIGTGIWFYRRRQQKKNGQPLGPLLGNDNPPGKPELSDDNKASLMGGYYAGNKDYNSVQGAELPSEPQTSPPSELPSQHQIPRELASEGGHGYSPQQQQQQQQQGWGQYDQQHPQSSSVSPLTPPGNQGMGWQSGPVQSYELDANMQR
ncbi:hypothetical protein NLU13_6595 [Sarocladium strictum]|uniref:Uncharacterized protein n=1 Tax=Sarocladium strictum TaxID=5046 RepID=A0AA39GGY0_SARSR|nr:hypothetical protein NLU13_6595 [Sarocladium strictum]